MKNYHMYCLSLHSENFDSLKKIQYTPVGLGNNIFTNEWLKDNTKINISHQLNNNLNFFIVYTKSVFNNLIIHEFLLDT